MEILLSTSRHFPIYFNISQLLYESVTTAGMYDSGSADSVVIGSADILLNAIVPCNIEFLCCLRFTFFVVRI